MKIQIQILLVIISFAFLSNCMNRQSTNETVTEEIAKEVTKLPSPQVFIPKIDSITDIRDGEIYKTVVIGKQIWMAENLRYEAKKSLFNPDNPLVIYGRLYDRIIAETVCPTGWHLPTDKEWNELEMSLGMLITDTNKTFWRGKHGTKMKSKTDWADDGNGTNSSGFNVYPSGYYFDDNSDEIDMYIGGSAGFWSATENGKAWIRFFGSPKEGVNRFNDNTMTWKLACRCVKD